MPRGNPLRLGGILGRVDVEERIDRRGRPVRDRNAVARGPGLDLAQPLGNKRLAQIAAQGNRPQPDDGMAPFSRARAGGLL